MRASVLAEWRRCIRVREALLIPFAWREYVTEQHLACAQRKGRPPLEVRTLRANPGRMGRVAAVLGSMIFFVVAPGLVILYEEPTLARAFGEEYADYRAHVGRWVPLLVPWHPQPGDLPPGD